MGRMKTKEFVNCSLKMCHIQMRPKRTRAKDPNNGLVIVQVAV